MKSADLREMTDEELESTYDDLMKESFNLRLQQSLGQLEKPSRLRIVRRDIARVLTVKSARKNAAAAAAAPAPAAEPAPAEEPQEQEA